MDFASLPSRLAQAIAAALQKRPALFFTAAILLVQAWFMRGMPVLVMLLLLLPAGLLIFVAAHGVTLAFKKRFSNPGSRILEVSVTAVLLIAIGLAAGFNANAWILTGLILLGLIGSARAGKGAFWTIVAGVWAAALFLFSHAVIVTEAGLLSLLSETRNPSSQYLAESKNNELKVREGGQDRLLLRVPPGMRIAEPAEVARLGIHSPGRPIAVLSGEMQREPFVILYELTGTDQGDQTAAYLAQLQFSGSIENLEGPLVDNLEIPGYALRGLAWQFQSAGGARMRMAIYCARTFDLGIAILENAPPGLPHEPLILDVLQSFWPGAQKGRSDCAL
jgi:hypothetical protein